MPLAMYVPTMELDLTHYRVQDTSVYIERMGKETGLGQEFEFIEVTVEVLLGGVGLAVKQRRI